MTNTNFQNDFLKILINLKTKNSNPFELKNSSSNNDKNYLYNPFGFYEDFFEDEILCPICLGRVSKAKKTLGNQHIFYFYCIKKWMKSSKKWPVCLRDIKSLLDLYINEKCLPGQRDLFITTNNNFSDFN